MLRISCAVGAVVGIAVLSQGTLGQESYGNPNPPIVVGPGTQGVAVYQGPQDPDFFWFCGSSSADYAEDVHLVSSGQLASFTFAFWMNANSPAAAPGDTVTATVRIYENNAFDSLTPPTSTLLYIETISGLPYTPGEVCGHTQDVTGGPTLPDDLWFSVEISGPAGSAGGLAGSSTPGGDPTVRLGTSHNVTWFAGDFCASGVINNGDFCTCTLNFDVTVRVFADTDCPDAIPNGDFEIGGLGSEWAAIGRTGAETAALGTPPASGYWQAVVSNGGANTVGGSGDSVFSADVEAFLGLPAGALNTLDQVSGNPAVAGSAIQQTITANAGDTLRFNWNFLSDESDDFRTQFNDLAFVSISPGDVTVLADTFFTRGPSGTASYAFETGYQTWSHTFATGGTYTVGLGVVDVGGTGTVNDFVVDSGLLIDCVELVPGVVGNNPPTCTADYTLAEGQFIAGATPNSFVVTEGHTIAVDFTGVDPDEDDLMVSSTGLPGTASLTPMSGASPLVSTLMWTPVAADKGASRTVTVKFSDPSGATSSPCAVTIEDVNLNPMCSASSQTVESTGPGGASVTLDGSATDPDDDDAELMFHWDTAVALDDTEIAAPTGTFPIGVTSAVLTVCDGRGGMDVCTVDITVEDPILTCYPDVVALWPPNHGVVEVNVTVAATDACASPGDIGLLEVRVRSDEPDDETGNGDGSTTGDVDGQDGYSLAAFGGVDVTSEFAFDPVAEEWTGMVLLRAEREGTGDGRVYTIDVRAEDASGNEAVTSCCVTVPHDRRGKKPKP